VCSYHLKPKKLMDTIKKIRDGEKKQGSRRKGLIIIFFEKIKTLQSMHNFLQKGNVTCVPFHSQLKQKERELQLNTFRCGKTPILLATDIAARGLHCNNVEYIINYDFPDSLEQYVHRSGRCGRNKKSGAAGKGTAYSFFNQELAPMASDLIELLRSCNAWVDPNLIALVPGGVKESGESKRKRRKHNKNGDEESAVDNTVHVSKKHETESITNSTDEDSEDEFPEVLTC